MSIQSFTIDIPQGTLDDLYARLARTRWPEEMEGTGWDAGTSLTYLKQLVSYWQRGYDWRAQEARLNQFAQFRTRINGLNVHFIHQRGKGPNAFPLLLTHGWPDSFYRFYKLIPLLTDPASHGGDPADAFDVIVPSLPGFGFSDYPAHPLTAEQTADMLVSLMRDVLGYPRYGAAGGDFGSGMTQLQAFAHPEALVGIHITDLGFYYLYSLQQPDLSEAERHYLNVQQGWIFREGAYALLQGTKPQTLSYGLNDSPVGLAGWIVEKFHSWSDCDGDIEQSYTRDELLTMVMLYWVTQTVRSSFSYYGPVANPKFEPGQRIEVPAAFACFPRDLPGINPPRELAERHLRIARWTHMPRGGHFAALEEPELLAEDLRAFFHPLRQG